MKKFQAATLFLLLNPSSSVNAKFLRRNLFTTDDLIGAIDDFFPTQYDSETTDDDDSDDLIGTIDDLTTSPTSASPNEAYIWTIVQPVVSVFRVLKNMGRSSGREGGE